MRVPGWMSKVLVLTPERHWECPNCGKQTVTRTARRDVPFHNCPSLKGMSAPLVDAERLKRERHRLVAVEREDYVGGEVGLRFDSDGVAIMAVDTERVDGSHDRTVFAPSATNRKVQ